MRDCLFFLRYMFQKYISSRNIFLVFVWGLWFVTKKIKALARLYLFNLLRNIHFCKKGHPYTQVGRKTIIYSSFLLDILNFFFSFFICLLHFCPLYRTPPGNGNGNFHTHHKLDIKTFVGLKGRHQKWQLRMAMSHLWFQALQVSKTFSWPSKLVWDTLFCDWGV